MSGRYLLEWLQCSPQWFRKWLLAVVMNLHVVLGRFGFLFLFFGLHGLVLLLFVLIHPLVFQLSWCNIVGKTYLVRVFGTLLWIGHGISVTYSVHRLGCNTMNIGTLDPNLFEFLVDQIFSRDIQVEQRGIG